MKYEFLDHTADAKIRAYGKTMEEAFCNIAYALTEIIMGKQKIKAAQEKKITVEGNDLNSLLYEFIDNILYLLDADQFVIGKIDQLQIQGTKLSAIVHGDTASKYKSESHVKAATYAEMRIDEKPGKVMIQTVVDL